MKPIKPRAKSRHVVIGPIRGYRAAMRRLLDRVRLTDADTLVYIPTEHEARSDFIESRKGPTIEINNARPSYAFESDQASPKLPAKSFLCVRSGVPSLTLAVPRKGRSAQKLGAWSYESPNGFRGREMGEQRSGDAFWADRYDGRFGFVMFANGPSDEVPQSFFHRAKEGVDPKHVAVALGASGSWLGAAVIEYGEVLLYRERALA